MKGYGSAIYWLENAPHQLTDPIEGTLSADVVIIGGGYTGLWTAYEIKTQFPGADVVLLEAEEVGFGASGRNGGFAMTLLDMSLAHLVRNHGPEKARAAHLAVASSVVEIGEVVTHHGIQCDYHPGGLFVVAAGVAQEQRVRADLDTAARIGLDSIREVGMEELRGEVHSPTYRMGDEHCAVIQPARLARGLKRVLTDLGVRIFETSPVTGFGHSQGDGVEVSTPGGRVVADQAVLATNAWASQVPEFKSKVVPLYTYIVLTEPLTDAQRESIGWRGGQGIEDKRNLVHYYRPTADGRILWGGTDAVVYAGRKISPRHDRSDRIFAKLEESFRFTFPQLESVRFTHRWGGPVAITGHFVPLFGTLDGGRIHYGLGYNGHGVAPAHTGGRILADLVLDKDREVALGPASAGVRYRDLFFVGGPEPRFPPDPVTWLGAALTRRSLQRQDARMDRGDDVGEMDPLLLRLAKKFT